MTVVPYQDAPSPPMTAERRVACEQALHVLTADGRWLRGEHALTFVYARLGYRWVTVFEVPPLSWAAAVGYRTVARHRRFFARFAFRTPEGD